MRALEKRVWVLSLVSVCLLLAQVHVWTHLDPCLWYPDAAHRSSHHASGHGCSGCALHQMVEADGSLALTVTLPAVRIEIQACSILGLTSRTEISSPRAPPLA